MLEQETHRPITLRSNPTEINTLVYDILTKLESLREQSKSGHAKPIILLERSVINIIDPSRFNRVFMYDTDREGRDESLPWIFASLLARLIVHSPHVRMVYVPDYHGEIWGNGHKIGTSFTYDLYITWTIDHSRNPQLVVSASTYQIN